MSDIATNFAQLCTTVDRDMDAISFMAVQSSLGHIQASFGHGDLLPDQKPVKTIITRAEFKLERDGPGHLSHLGPRHDNDRVNITEIKIMPTSQEILCSRTEYLPTTNLFDHHARGTEALLDHHFRLLREDSVGVLRDAVKVEYEKMHGIHEGGRSTQHARTITYKNAYLQNIQFHKFRGIDLIYKFEQPREVTRMESVKQRRNWWEASRRLQSGSLVCLLDERGVPIFCSVSYSGLQDPDGPQRKMKEVPEYCNVYSDPKYAYVLLTSVDFDQANVDAILAGYVTGQGRGSETLIEFPGVLLQSFRPTLVALQEIGTRKDLPFAQYLAPSQPSDETVHTIQPPAYTSGNFRFKLDSLVGKDNNHLTLSTSQPFDSGKLEDKSTLDKTQSEALVNALKS